MDRRHPLSLRAKRKLLDPRALKPGLLLMQPCLDREHDEGALSRISFDGPTVLFLFKHGIAAQESRLQKPLGGWIINRGAKSRLRGCSLRRSPRSSCPR